MQNNYGNKENTEIDDNQPSAVTSDRHERESDATSNEADIFAHKLEGLFVDSDEWISADNSREEYCSCNPLQLQETQQSLSAKYPEIEYSHISDTDQNESASQIEPLTDTKVLSASDLLQSVVESYRDALKDQRSVMASQTEAIIRLAAAIEDQTKMIRLLRENNL